MTEIKNFVGEFEIRDNLGNVKSYTTGDVVVYENKQYIATENTSGFSPLHGDRGGWKELNLSKSMNFTNSETQPEIATEGDHWFDSSSGKLYIYIKDKDTEQWIEL